MLLRDTNASDFRVPTAPRPQIAIDSANAKADRIAADALNRRDERDARLAAAHERARARLHFVKTFADEGQQSKGLVARMDEALKTYKSSAGALDGEAFAALAREVRAEALRIEAMARARDRVLQTGKTLDRLIEATRAAPQNFEAHAEAAREAVEGQQLPAKAASAFRARLAEIPEAALAALIGSDPEHAAELIKKREGPAGAAFGLDRETLRVLGKQAAAAIEQARAVRTNGANIDAMRAHADAANGIAAAGRGEGDEAGLTAWLAQAETIGTAATRTLRRQSKAASKVVANRKAAVATVRERLARGEDIADADEDSVDRAYAERAAADTDGGRAFTQRAGRLPAPVVSRIAADLKSGDAPRTLRAAEFVVTLEAKDANLLARLPEGLRAEAHTLAAAAKAGFTPAEAHQYLRDATDLHPHDRNRRTRDFDRAANGVTFAHAIEQAFAIRVAGIADA